MKKAVIYLTLFTVLFVWLPTGASAGYFKHFSKYKFWCWPWKEVQQQLNSHQQQLNSHKKQLRSHKKRIHSHQEQLDLHQEGLTSLEEEVAKIWEEITPDQGGSSPEPQYASFHVSVDESQNIVLSPQEIMFHVIDHNIGGTFLEEEYTFTNQFNEVIEIKYLVYLVPYDGVYHLSYNLGFVYSTPGYTVSSSINVEKGNDGEIIKSTQTIVDANTFASLGSSFTIKLKAGDQIYVTANCFPVGLCQVVPQPTYAHFSGHLVHP